MLLIYFSNSTLKLIFSCWLQPLKLYFEIDFEHFPFNNLFFLKNLRNR